MGKLHILQHTVLTYEYTPYKEIYWDELTKFVISKYGNQAFDEYNLVDECLNDCFAFFVDHFESLVSSITNFKFFCYVFKLHEDSLKLMIKDRNKELDLFNLINESEFASYRRILKIILEQGSKNELVWGEISHELIKEFDEIIQRLVYIGSWIYNIADNIAYHRMLKGAYFITFEDGDLIVHWKNNFGTLLLHLMSHFSKGYETDVVDQAGTKDLRAILEKCYGINYDQAFGLVFEIQRHHSTNICQTIEPWLLAHNLKSNFTHLTDNEANSIYNGLILSRENCLTITETVLKPYSTERFLLRPYLVYKINNEKRLLTSVEKFAESMYVLSTNAIQWNTLNPEWQENLCLRNYKTKKGNEHDKHLEDKIQDIMLKKKIMFSRNIKSLKTNTANNINIDNSMCGEIDFIIIDTNRNQLIVADSKYNKSRYEAVGYRQDYTNFTSKNEPQLSRKISWISKNLNIIDQHFKRLYPSSNLDLTTFEVKGIFLINTPTFYMFCSKYLTIASNYFESYISGENIYPDIKIETAPNVFKKYQYPYFISKTANLL